MSEEQKPDTTEAVAKALDAFDLEGPALGAGGDYAHWPDRRRDAEIAIAAHNEELERRGKVVVDREELSMAFHQVSHARIGADYALKTFGIICDGSCD